MQRCFLAFICDSELFPSVSPSQSKSLVHASVTFILFEKTLLEKVQPALLKSCHDSFFKSTHVENPWIFDCFVIKIGIYRLNISVLRSNFSVHRE